MTSTPSFRLPCLTPLLLATVVACSAGAGDEGEEETSSSSTGGESSQEEAEPSATGGLGGASAEEEITHPWFGAGNYTSAPPTDPCQAAQHWEESINLDMTPGALILKDGVVWEVTGEGKGDSVWTDEWTAPPCEREDGHCEDLAYEEVAVCD